MAAIVWVAGFTVYFFSRGLPNNSPWTRGDLWRESPWLILDSLLPPVALPGETPSASGWRFLPQRFPRMAYAGLVLVGTWHLGSLLLRWLVQSTAIPPGLWFALSGLAGLSAWSLMVLGLGLVGALWKSLFFTLLIGFIVVEFLAERRRSLRPRFLSHTMWRAKWDAAPWIARLCWPALVPFLLAMALGALLPSTDFDVKAYHLVGPKEWFLAGQISFLPHNVYTAFPFLTEMQLLSTMVLAGDWFDGGMAGQLVLASFGLHTSIIVFQVASRFGPRAGWLAAFVYLTTPWVVRISIIAYVEGALAAYLAAALAAYLCSRSKAAEAWKWTALCGFFAGSAAACKYPGIISALIPFGVLVVVGGFSAVQSGRVREAVVRGAVFSAGGLIAFGPWLLKNLVQTGNPVYPLLWNVFGGREFDAVLNAKFKAGHALPVEVLRSPAHWLPDLWRHLWDIAVGSDWQSPLMFGLAPLAVVVWIRASGTDETSRERRRQLGMVLAFTLWLFLTWWALTHRIDRFWVPMLPMVAVLSGVALEWMRDQANRPLQRLVVDGLLVGVTCYHLAFIASPFIGFNGYLMDDSAARRVAETPGMTIINRLPDDAKVLLIGEAQVFEARRSVLYSTVFNRNLFEDFFATPAATESNRPMKPADEIDATLQKHGITHVLVNWNEVLRYRTTYGYSDFVTPENVRQLERWNLLEPLPLPDGPLPQKVADKPDSTRDQLNTWGKSLVSPSADGDWYPAYELWRVVPLTVRA
jgi:hypothetical protein